MIGFWTEVTKNATVNATVGYLRGVGGVQTYCRHCARDVRRSVRYSIFVGNIRYSRCSDLASRAKYRSKRSACICIPAKLVPARKFGSGSNTR